MFIYIYTLLYNIGNSDYTGIHTYTHSHTYTHIRKYTSVYIYTNKYLYIYIYMDTRSLTNTMMIHLLVIQLNVVSIQGIYER